ncbi:alpha/beta hydrolase [Clostridium lacusfryxellense]|uniref:alpha/beta hydrolase n=1 Tax=Clostridium lacusfryxellense TaxID=205328 RepID=UPI001C0E051A|nr:alpha/beta hydrolase family protein [Clostridium lacusfryxellense]MBU3110027.1 esterase family protein [Clostridium lacusfryxellense]
MALIHCDFFSETLGISTSITVILPQNTKTQIGVTGSKKKEKYPVLYLLHGLSDDQTIWQRNTSIERYVADMGLAVVMPNAGRSFYTDMKHGYKYWTYITEELPEIVASFFPISSLREDNFIAGLSMGGYGAFKAALSYPDKYSAGASLSGALNMNTSLISETDEDFKMELSNIFGDISSFEGSENDLFFLASNLESCARKPKLYQCCGTEDFLYEDNIKFKNFIKSKDFDYTYEEGVGIHEWGYWDAQIQKVLKWLPLK